MNMNNLKMIYKKLLYPVFGEKFCIDDSEECNNWVAIMLDGEKEEFFFSMYGIDCVHLYWCNQCFIFDKQRNLLVSSDTYGEIVFEGDFDIDQLPQIVSMLILQLKDCTYVGKKEIIKGKIPSGYDYIKDYILIAKTNNLEKSNYEISNIKIEYI